ncbi:MAG: preprotein translocase subunit SecE [Helicobacteraceae bacterium]|jgi:preprotein translocase subunit SecE|nr:preprotein translocase subunit SecE [Helicobacteraceae bacterium]
MRKLISYIKLSRAELGKVIFPLSMQVKSAFIAVFAVVTVITLFLALVDLLMSLSVSSVVN